MHRRALIQTGAFLTAVAVTSTASASSDKAAPTQPVTFDMTVLGLPNIQAGRLAGYIFVVMKLHLAQGQRIETAVAKQPYLRDALVRAAHRTPFVQSDGTLNVPALSASLMQVSNRLMGQGAVTRVELVSQRIRR